VSGDWIRTRLNDLPDLAKKLWLCGGARVYKEFLPLCESVYVTHIMEEYEGDTFMSEFEPMFPNGTVIQEHPDFWVAQYWK
jgi:dihydrofolate reductase